MPALATSIAIALVVLGLLAGVFGVLRHAPRHRAVLLALQLAVALSLAAALLLPPRAPDDALHVSTTGADAAEVARLAGQAPRVALPGADADAGAWRVPDLATALRMHPGTTRLVVHGHGLEAHDRAAASGLAVTFEGEPPPGIVAMEHPQQVRPGTLWKLSARLRIPGPEDLAAQLRGPSGSLLDESPVGADGLVSLRGAVPVAGRHELRLEVRRGDDLVEAVPVVVAAVTPPAMRGLLLAGAPSPELRALRRWAEDAGVALDARFRLAPTLALGGAPARIDAAQLAELDLLVLDERSLAQRTAAEREAIAAAVRDGLGLLIRLGAPPDDAAKRALRALGVAVEGEPEVTSEVLLPPPWQAPKDRQPLHAWMLGDPAPGAADLLRSREGARLGWWRALGQGRVGVLLLADSYRLAARGDARAHADLWSTLWQQLARAGDANAPVVEPPPATGEVARVCGGEGELAIETPGGERLALRRDPGADGCARWLAADSGWHVLHAGGLAVDAGQAIHVADPSQHAALLAEERFQQTHALARSRDDAPAPRPGHEEGWHPPFDRAAWLLLALLAWTCSAGVERSLRRRAA